MIKNRLGFFNGTYFSEKGVDYQVSGVYEPIPNRQGEVFDPQNQMLWVRYWLHGAISPTNTFQAFMRYNEKWEIGDHGAFFGFKPYNTFFLNWLKDNVSSAIEISDDSNSIFVDELKAPEK